MNLDDLPYLNAEQRRRRPNAKLRSRLDEKVALKRDTARLDIAFRLKVWRRDAGKCRVCGVTVKRTLELDPKRGEVHHVARRDNRAVKFDARNGLLVCGTCHEALTRYRLQVVGTAVDTFIVDGKTYLNADRPLRFVRRR